MFTVEGKIFCVHFYIVLRKPNHFIITMTIFIYSYLFISVTFLLFLIPSESSMEYRE